MMAHHDHSRGQVYKTTRRPSSAACLDCCFDCTVLWETLSAYAEQNDLDPYDVLSNILRYHVYTPRDASWWGSVEENNGWNVSGISQRWWDVQWALKNGKLTEAIAAL